MKHRLTAPVFGLLFAIPPFATAQYNLHPDAPINPVPIKFHKDHFFLKGDLKTYTIGKGRKATQYEFDEQGYVRKKSIGQGAAGVITVFAYSRPGILQSTTLSNLRGLKTSFTTDEKERPIRKVFSNGSSALYEYDSKGNLIAEYRQPQKGTRYLLFKYEYDPQGRLIRQEYFPEGAKQFYSRETYQYSRHGNFVKVTTIREKPTVNKANWRQQLHVYRKDTTSAYYVNGHYLGELSSSIRFDAHHNPLLSEHKYTYYSGEAPTPSHGNCAGDCQNGWGTATFDEGSYTGFWKDGARHGYGKFVWINGITYHGQWHEDTISGLGILLENNRIQYYGEFMDGMPNGYGVTVDAGSNNTQQGLYLDGTLVTPYSMPATGHTTGCVAGDCAEEYGKYVWENGNVFIGFWIQKRPYVGIYRLADGTSYLGYLGHEMRFDGFGFYQSPSGDEYMGQWKNGRYHQKGYLRHSSGHEQIGLWEDGKLVKSMKH